MHILYKLLSLYNGFKKILYMYLFFILFQILNDASIDIIKFLFLYIFNYINLLGIFLAQN